ncbi:MAG: hypothetical protein UV68_C0018G0014 [Candidatus Collierbacteria bacterium GW2011_GWC2_43_12]|uniref:Fibronectin type-III domain-containing protein n=1 Tax=Candidatus Collierbacteria bacterium GW2011_GWC2_43_12 TaxID=1618390 RepID=A0A0G1FEZ3_9BACT|nr:MAG: hypothetical protein UV68_C0018G0014 [Candidatus Collierbacteria bacterium GW2011_GWC2_43_12]
MKAKILFFLSIFATAIIFIGTKYVYAATTPSLGTAATFGILASTYTNTVGGTTITGDLGYTTGPAVAPTVTGTTHIADATYSSAGTDQGAAKTNLDGQACTHTFPAGAVDLATDTSHGTLGVYAPGVYCTAAASAASIGAGGITLSGSGTYIFRITGALTTVDNSVVSLDNGASSCDVFWTPVGATTLGANSTFIGTDIDDAGITIGSTVSWTGRALAFGGTISTTSDTITTTCSVAPTPTPTPTPTATPTPTPVTSSTSSSSTSTTTTSSSDSTDTPCPPLKSGIVTPEIIESRRVDADSIFLSWGPDSGINTFNIRYGPSDGDWLYNTDVAGFSTTINSLPSGQALWFQVAARNECQIGSFGSAVPVGGSSGAPGFPNTGGIISSRSGVPRFPDTGFAPRNKNVYWFLSGSVLLLFFIALKIKISSRK